MQDQPLQVRQKSNPADAALGQVAGTYRPRFRLDPRVIRVPVIPGCDPRTACAASAHTPFRRCCMPGSVHGTVRSCCSSDHITVVLEGFPASRATFPKVHPCRSMSLLIPYRSTSRFQM